MRVLVCGGREFENWSMLNDALHKVNRHIAITVLIHGGARGADIMAGHWAMCNNVAVEVYPANWELYRRRAGTIRNAQMLHKGKPEVVIAFPGGVGTAHMIKIAREKGLDVWEPGNA